MNSGIIVVQTGAIEEGGRVYILPHWYFILKAYGELLPGTRLVCRRNEELRGRPKLPVPNGLKAELLSPIDFSTVRGKLKGYVCAHKKIKKLVKEAKFIGAVLPSNLGGLAVRIAIGQAKPIFVEVAGESKMYDWRPSIKLPFRYLAYRYSRHVDVRVSCEANLVIYVSQYLADIAARRPRVYGVVPCTTVYDRDVFRREDTCQDGRIKLFSVNRIVREKGLKHLLLAIKKLRNEGFDVVATLAGDGEYLEELKRQSCELCLDDCVCFPGYVSVEELWQLYRKSDIFVMPTIASGEGTPRCLIEAMASGCPVVASSVGGIKMMLEEAKSGKLVAAGNIDELAEAIKLIITNLDLRRKYIANGLKWVTGVTLEKRTEKIADLFEQHLRLA